MVVMGRSVACVIVSSGGVLPCLWVSMRCMPPVMNAVA